MLFTLGLSVTFIEQTNLAGNVAFYTILCFVFFLFVELLSFEDTIQKETIALAVLFAMLLTKVNLTVSVKMRHIHDVGNITHNIRSKNAITPQKV
jgi:hypothetical protein